MKTNRYRNLAVLHVLTALVASGGGRSVLANQRPVAEVGLPRYVGVNPVRLDGTGSYDPDHSGTLTYAWRQIAGPPVTMTGANSATPLLGGFGQTGALQECGFELIVSDGKLTSLPATAKVIIVPSYGDETLRLEHTPFFDPNKPTFIYFGGGDCIDGYAGQAWGDSYFASRANVIGFPMGYAPDSPVGARTYYKYGDMIIAYLSSMAPDYHQQIQTAGWSTGGQPAIDVGLRLNLTYRDPRYAVSHVTLLDAARYCGDHSEAIQRFLASAVDGQSCWIDSYNGDSTHVFFPGVLNVGTGLNHPGVRNWYRNSPTVSAANAFNNGLVAGAYWSVIGPGKNLQLAPTPDKQIYAFRWVNEDNETSSSSMDFYSKSLYPGRLPEPVTLEAWVSRSKASGQIDGAVLSCRSSENAVGYQLLFGSDPYRVIDFEVVSDTPAPPMEIRRQFPAGRPWWTVRVRDQYGSTIYADPVFLDLTNLPPLSVENARTGKRYGLIDHALRDAQAGDIIRLDPAIYEESIEFHGLPVTVSSVNPSDPAVVAATVIRGPQGTPAVTFSGPESKGCALAGLTIQSDTVGISCRDAAPTIRQCVVENAGGIALEFWSGYAPNLVACTILGQVKEDGDPGLIDY